MGRVTYGSRGGRVRVTAVKGGAVKSRSVEEVVRELKAAQQPGDASYRERSLALHGMICARCGREFAADNRHLLTVHHKDGNHQNNPADGSNWENLCIYCHENEHSRGLLGDYLNGTASGREEAVVYRDEQGLQGMGSLGERLRKALQKKSES